MTPAIVKLLAGGDLQHDDQIASESNYDLQSVIKHKGLDEVKTACYYLNNPDLNTWLLTVTAATVKRVRPASQQLAFYLRINVTASGHLSRTDPRG